MEGSPTLPTATGNNSKLMEGFQKIEFSVHGEESVEVFATEVIVVPSEGNHDSGSSRVKLHNIVDYTWEERFYTGQLLAVHMAGKYIAYGIKATNRVVGNVRVVNRETDERTLIKGLEAEVQDIAFAHIPNDIIVACVDIKGNLFIHKVMSENSRLMTELLLHILPDPSCVPHQPDFFRVIWCPYIPEIPDENHVTEDLSYLLALSRGKKVELWNVKLVTEQHSSGPVTPEMVEVGYLEIVEHTQPIVDAAFAPDGTAVATASLDGEVKFFQVYMQHGKKPRCLHQWQPHRGQPLSSLFFLDNHKNYNPEIQFWKFAVTGANNNSEIKVWSCETWSCLQTVRFEAGSDKPIKLKVCLDLTAGYLLLSNFHHKLLYVFELYANNLETAAAVVSISEFLLPYPILSFGIVDAGIQRFKSKNLEEVCNDINDDQCALGVLVKMYLLQPKSLQDCQIAFIPPLPGSADRTQLLMNGLAYHNSLTELNVNVSNGELNVSSSSLQELPANHSHSSMQLNLMTPDAFNSPAKLETSGSSLMKALEEPSYSNTTTLVASPHSVDETDNTLLVGLVNNANNENTVVECLENMTQLQMVMGFASGGSSPSREVQEILGEGKRFYEENDEVQQDQDPIDLTTPEEKVVANVWPEIPMLRADEVRKNEEQARLSVLQGECSGATGDEMWKMNQRLETSISSMIHVMNSLMQSFEEQANEIKQMKERQDIQQQSLLREVDKIVSCNTQQIGILLDKVVSKIESKQNHEILAATVSQSVTNFLSSKFVDSVNNEISKMVKPVINHHMESLKHQVNVELNQKLSTTDHLLKDNIAKLVENKTVIDLLSSAVVSSLTPVISQCYKEYFTNIALPSFERSCSTMFNQINDTFSKGSKEFVNIIDNQSRRFAEKNREQNLQLQGFQDALKNSIAGINADLMTSVANIEKRLVESVTNALSMQQAALEGSVMAAVRSRAVTPAPHLIDTQVQQQHILQLISQGQVNTAFQQALSASDLSLVVFVCEKVNPQQLFSQVPCPLQQHVLLSLVQQLSADMTNHTEIKHKYLEEALMNLDVNNTVTREHLPTILNSLQRQLQAYISSNPNNRITRSMRLLLMASKALLGNCASTPR